MAGPLLLSEILRFWRRQWCEVNIGGFLNCWLPTLCTGQDFCAALLILSLLSMAHPTLHPGRKELSLSTRFLAPVSINPSFSPEDGMIPPLL